MGARRLHTPVPPTGQNDVHLLLNLELLPNSELSLLAVPLVHCVQSLTNPEMVPSVLTLAQTSCAEPHSLEPDDGAGPLFWVRSMACAT